MAEDTWKPDADRLVTNDLQMFKCVSQLKRIRQNASQPGKKGPDTCLKTMRIKVSGNHRDNPETSFLKANNSPFHVLFSCELQIPRLNTYPVYPGNFSAQMRRT